MGGPRQNKTLDALPSVRCMTVALGAAEVAACRTAILPVEIVRVENVKEACDRMATVLPLVVIVDEGMTPSDRATLAEFTTACGAEIVPIPEGPAADALSWKLLEGLRTAERRRLRG